MREEFNVACFTEVPLSQLHLVIGKIPGRDIELEPYGLVFTKEFIASMGAQPAIYVNSYNGKTDVRKAVDYLYSLATASTGEHTVLRRLIPFINAMHEKYDFTWEREWRITENLKFKMADVVCLILPENKEDSMREKAMQRGIPVVSPGWTYEQIITELAKQQRSTKKFFRSDAGSAKKR